MHGKTKVGDGARAARFISEKEVLARFGFSRATMRRRIAAGEFPPAVRIGMRRVAWLESAVDEFADRVVREAEAAARSRAAQPAG